ncbi:MAG: hypothetical protein RBS43_00830 [Candidatus Cloacimonas sp.]|nr:hypothetical protein [Candidatus Cloacimonas sp.]
MQDKHLSSILTDLINGLDTRLRGYDKKFSNKLGGGYDKKFSNKLGAGNDKKFSNKLGAGNSALINPIRDDTNKALQYKHISTVLTYLINGLDTRLCGYDRKTWIFLLDRYKPFKLIDRT